MRAALVERGRWGVIVADPGPTGPIYPPAIVTEIEGADRQEIPPFRVFYACADCGTPIERCDCGAGGEG